MTTRLHLFPILVLLILASSLVAACGAESSESEGASVAPTAENAPSAPAPNSASPPAATGKPGPLGFDMPEGWEEHPPTSGMRAAQAVIPGEAGPGEMIVFYFGPGQGGEVDDNIDRWIGQVQQPEGATPERDSFQVGDLTVTHVTVHGTLMPSGMGSGPTEPQPDSALMAAVVEGPGGPWFFKVTGPAATLDDEREAFLDMLHTVRPPA